MTSNILFYYSRKGNTKALVNLFTDSFVIDEVTNIRNYNLNDFSTIVFATSTYGRGVPPKAFFNIRDILVNLKGKRIGLFGSGNSHYEYFCGALDLLEEMLKGKNQILFNYKFEGYPKKRDKEELKNILSRCL